MKALQMC